MEVIRWKESGKERGSKKHNEVGKVGRLIVSKEYYDNILNLRY